MGAPADSAVARKRRWPRLQFSLRVLLAAFTLFAVGFPIWYRWPYTEKESYPPNMKQSMFSTVTTWRRTWGGGREKHGPWSREDTGGRLILVHYENDVRSGPYAEYYKGAAKVTGQHAAGRRTGEWVDEASDGGQVRATWKEGRRHGVTEIRPTSGTPIFLGFHEGVLIAISGQPPPRSWARVEAKIKSDAPKLARCLNDEAGVEFVLTPLDEAVQILFDNHGIPGLIRIDRDRVDANLPVTSWVTDLDLLSTLAVVAKQHDLDVDYRYGCLWFTSTEIPEWTDPTGVAAIQPTAGTPLAAIWNEPVSVDTSGIPPHTQPLARVLGAIAEPLGIDIDVTKIEPPLDDPDRYSRMCILRKHPFHQTLGILLYETGCRCRLEGGRLVVLPPENPSTDRG